MSNTPPPPRFSPRPRPLGDMIPALTREVFGRKNQLFGKMLAAWPQIAGDEVAALTVPLDLKFQRAPKAENKNTQGGQAVLHLAVQPAYALEFSYQKPLLIERINMFFGYAAIRDIKITQHSEIMLKNVAPPLPKRPLSAQELEKLDTLTGAIQEKDLQIALKNLGKAILSRLRGA